MVACQLSRSQFESNTCILILSRVEMENINGDFEVEPQTGKGNFTFNVDDHAPQRSSTLKVEFEFLLTI